MTKEIIDAFAEKGLDPGFFPLDGKIHRFKVEESDSKKSGWAIGYQNHTINGGEVFHVVVFGNFRTGETNTYQTGTVTLSADDKKRVREQISKAKRQKYRLKCLYANLSKRDKSIYFTIVSTGG